MVELLKPYDLKRLLLPRGFRWRGIRAVRECLTGFHFLGGLMSFENFIPESTRRVVRLPFWRKVPSSRTDTHRAETGPARSVKETQRSHERRTRRRSGRILAEGSIGTQSPAFCGQKRAELFFRRGARLYKNCNHENESEFS